MNNNNSSNVDWRDLRVCVMDKLLDISVLRRCALTSQSWKRASADDEIWLTLCQLHWATKAPQYHLHYPGRKAFLLEQNLGWKRQYQAAEATATRMTLDDISLHRFDFSFRIDPSTRASNKFNFNPDGRVSGHPMELDYEWRVLDDGAHTSMRFTNCLLPNIWNIYMFCRP